MSPMRFPGSPLRFAIELSPEARWPLVHMCLQSGKSAEKLIAIQVAGLLGGGLRDTEKVTVRKIPFPIAKR